MILGNNDKKQGLTNSPWWTTGNITYTTITQWSTKDYFLDPEFHRFYEA